MDQLREKHIESAAKRFRTEVAIDFCTCPDIDSVLDRFCALRGIKLIRHFDDEIGHSEAFADAEHKEIHYRETSRAQLKNGDRRARFVFMEEIAHVVLGHRGIRFRNSSASVSERAVPQVRRDEAEARRFAAAVLAPMDRIDPSWDAVQISDQFQISLTAAEIRKEECDKMRRAASSSKRELPDFVIDFLKESKARGERVTTNLD